MPTDKELQDLSYGIVSCVFMLREKDREEEVNRRIRYAFGLPGAKAGAPPPKPIRLHAGQTWAKGGEEATITYLNTEKLRTRDDVGVYNMGSSNLTINGFHEVTDANGWTLIGGPGFNG